MSLPESLRTELERIVGADGVLTDPIQLLAYDCDAYTIEKALPTAVVLPQTASPRWCKTPPRAVSRWRR